MNFEPDSMHPYIGKHAIGGRLKRIFDICVCLSIVLFSFPLLISIALILKVADPGPVIFRHVRIGLWGRRFHCFKFRTMVVDADKTLQALLEEDPSIRAEWERGQKLSRDPRVTPVGRFLRESSLDELPQLINVLRGEMSLVGPRPIVPAEMLRYGDRLGFYVSARPGLTGLWQISGRSNCGYDKRVELDADYVSNWRFAFDISILVRTISAVIRREGSC